MRGVVKDHIWKRGMEDDGEDPSVPERLERTQPLPNHREECARREWSPPDPEPCGPREKPKAEVGKKYPQKGRKLPSPKDADEEKKPYEEGSILMDAPEHDTMWELAELARTNDKELWRLNANVPACKQNPIPARVTRSRMHALREGLSACMRILSSD